MPLTEVGKKLRDYLTLKKKKDCQQNAFQNVFYRRRVNIYQIL